MTKNNLLYKFLVCFTLMAGTTLIGCSSLTKDKTEEPNPNNQELVEDIKQPEVIEPDPEPVQTTLKLSFVGDAMLATYKGSTAPGTLNWVMDNYDEDFLFKNVVDIFRQDDWTIANLENVFTDSPLKERDKGHSIMYWYRSAAKNANIFKRSSIEVLSLANNHTYDYGEQGYLDTKAALDAAKLEYGYEGKNIILEKDGVKLGLICTNLWYEGYAATVSSYVKELKESCDYVIVYFHGGTERVSTPDAWKVRASRTIADAGADLIIGHHPHVLQPMEIYNDTIIVQSLGNFLFGGGKKEENRSLIFQLLLTVEDGKIIGSDYEMIPCYLYSAKDSSQPEFWIPSIIEDEAEAQKVIDFMHGLRKSPL